MMKNIYLICIMTMFLANGLVCQENDCGSEPMDTIEFASQPYFGNNQYLLDLLDSVGINSSDSNKLFDEDVLFRVPLKIWNYRDGQGNGGVNFLDLKEWVQELNDYQVNNVTGMRFYLLCDISNIDNGDHLNVTFFSGGTESTAFNLRMVKALRTKNFDLEQIEKGDNPKYILKGVAKESSIYFSKKYDHDANPKKDFIAVMVCDHAAENCPVVFGADARIPLTYIDPKNADDAENESAVYLKKIDEIGAEMKYLMNRVKTSI